MSEQRRKDERDELARKLEEALYHWAAAHDRADQLSEALRRIEAIPPGTDDDGIYTRSLAAAALDIAR